MDQLTGPVVTLGLFALTQFAYLLWMLSKLSSTVESHARQLEAIRNYEIPQNIAVLRQQFTDMYNRLERIETKLDRAHNSIGANT
jgi:hypothetical protein